MKKYSEEKEEEQWDDDFIFDAAPVPKKKVASAPLSITSHLSVASVVTSKEKKKTTSSNSTWSNAFKKMGPDPRQNSKVSSSRVSHSSSSQSTTSTTARTVTSTVAHNIAPIGANEEFAFFDSEDTVGFKRGGPSAVKTNLQPAVKPAPSSSSSKKNMGSGKAGHSFDEGLDQNLGFDDEDFIPNVGFDDDEEVAATPKGKGKKKSIEPSLVGISLSSHSGQSGFSSSALSDGLTGTFDESGSALSDNHSQHSSLTSASKMGPASHQQIQHAPSSSSITTAASSNPSSLPTNGFSLAHPSATADSKQSDASNGSVASVVAMINAKRPSPVRPVPFFGKSPSNNLSNSNITPTSAQSGSSNNNTNITGATSHSPTHSTRSAASTMNNHRTAIGQQQQPNAADTLLEQQLEDLIESDQPLAFDVLDSLHSNSSSSFSYPQQQLQRDHHSHRLSGSSYDPLNNNNNNNNRHSAGRSPTSQIVAGVSNAAYDYSNSEIPVRRSTGPLSVASGSVRENYHSTGSKGNIHSRSNSGNMSFDHINSSSSSPRAASNSMKYRSDKNRLSAANSVSSIPLSVSDSESLDGDWGAKFGYNGHGRSSFSTVSSVTTSPRNMSQRMTLPVRLKVDVGEVDFGSDENDSDDADSPFGGALHTPSERGSLRSGHRTNKKNRNISVDQNDGMNSSQPHGTSDFVSEAGESWLESSDIIDARVAPEEQEEGLLIRHTPRESLDGAEVGLSREFDGSDSQGSGFHSDLDSHSSGSYYSGSGSSCTHTSDEEEGDWDLDLEIPHAGEGPHPGNNTQTYKEILTGKAAVGGATHTEETPSEEERESLLEFLKSTVHKTIFPPSLSQINSPLGLEPGLENSKGAEDPAEQQYQSNLGASCDSGDSDPGYNRNNHPHHKHHHSHHQQQQGQGPKGTIPKSTSTPSLSSRSHNNEAYEEEGHNVETANPHLRGLLNWVDASATSLHAVLSNANSNRDFNARTLLQSEVQLPRDDPLFVEHLLDRCEVIPCSDACIPTLETVCKWLRGVCNLHENVMGALHSNTNNNNNNPGQDSLSDCDPRLSSSNSSANLIAKMRRTASLGETRASQFSNHSGGSMKVLGNHSYAASSSSAAAASSAPPDVKFGELTSSRLDRIYDSCDDILQEQLVATTSALGAGYRKLLDINTRHVASQARAEAQNNSSKKASLDRSNSKSSKNNHWLSMGMVAVRDPVTYGSPPPQTLQPQTSVSSLSRINSTASDDDQLVIETFRLSANLISLYRLQVNMLEMRIHLYDSFELIACMELLQKISEELDKVTSTLFAALRRVLPAVEKCGPEHLQQRQQLDALTVVANDLLGCCFSIKLLAISAVSPITFQPLPENCQRIVSSASDVAKMNSFDGLSGSEDSRGGATVKSDGLQSVAPPRVPYNVIYELTLGTHFLDLMLLIPSPSVVRSKLCIAAYTYLQKLKKKQLPWQSQEFKLVSIRQHLESFANMFNLYNGADAFGLNYSEMENNSFTLSLTEVESSIVQSFSEVFGTLDQPRIMQLLLFEGSCELLPTVQRDLAGAAAFLHKPVQRPPPTHSAFVGAGLIPDTVESDISDPSHNGPKGPWGTFTSIRSAFRHISAALNFDKPLQVTRRRWVPSLAPIHSLTDSTSAKDGGTVPAIDVDAGVFRTVAASPIDLADPVTGKVKSKSLSYSMRYELFHFSNQVLFRLAQSIVEMSPNVALDVYQMCILLLAHLRHTHDRARVEKVAAMLAVKVGRRDAAIWHGEAVLKDLQRTGDNINEMLYMTDLLAAQYSENAQYELAAKALFSAISVLNRRHKHAHAKRQMPEAKTKKFKLTRHGSKEASLLFGARIGSDNNADKDANSAMDFERALDPLLLKLGRLLLQFGCPDRAADTFQVLLSSLCERTDCLANDAKKVTVLSWLAEAYLELEDYSSCAQVLGAIKSVRDLKLRKATAWAASGGNLDALADASEKAKTSPLPSPRQRPRAASRAASGVGALMRMSSGFIGRSGSRDIPLPPAALETRSGSAPVVTTESFDAVLMSTSYDISAEVARPPSRGIANAGSADSFDLEPKPLTNLPQRPLPPTPSSSGMHQTSPVVSDAAVLRSRPLPPTPRTSGGGPKNAQQESHATLQRRPLPPTPLDRTLSRENSGSMSEASSTGTGRRKKPNLRIDVNVRPTSSSSITDDIVQEKQDKSNSSNIASSSCSAPTKPRRTTPKVGGGHSNSSSVPVPLSTRSNSVHGTPSGVKRRKNRALKNLAPLQMPASPATSQLQPAPLQMPASPATSQLQPGMSGSGSTTESPAVAFEAGTLTPLSIPGLGSKSYSGGSPRAGPVGMSPVGGGVAVSSMCLHYLRNSPESNLPQFCVTTEDLDLGLLKARLHFKNKHYALALKCLLPTIMGVELTVIGTDRASTPISGNVKHNWSRQSLMELGELYYLRGKIQLEAAQSSAEVAFPLQVGSTHLFQKVQEVLWVEEKHGRLASSTRLSLPNKTRAAPEGPVHPQHQQSAQPRRFARAGSKKSGKSGKSGKPPTAPAQQGRSERHPISSSNSGPTLSFACRHPSKYTCPADLCWDAMFWFNRAREVARLANDEVGGALAANASAMCHLLPTFVPTALYGVPFEQSRDLSAPGTAAATSGSGSKRDKDASGRTSRVSISRSNHRPTRCASMVEVQGSMEAALEVNAHSCLPLPLITSYLNLAEMCVLVGDKENAFLFWNETKELFMLLFADGALVPLVRRASMRFIRKLTLIVNRMVRFMWTLDRATVNSNLYLLDLQIILSHEVERAQRKYVAKASAVSDWLSDVLDRLLPVQPGQAISSAKEGADNGKSQKRSSKSRLSRFFKRIFPGSMKSSKGGATSEDEPFSSQRSAAEEEHGGRGVRRVSLNNEDLEHSGRDGNNTAKPKLSSMRSLFFINRFGFEANLDVRRFYNLMNTDLVLEKVHDFGWSNCVEHDQLLKPIGPAESDPAERPFSISSVQSGASSVTAQVHYTASSGLGLAGSSISTNIDVLVILNMRAKAEYQEKYRSLNAARFVKDHVLRRGDLTMPPEADEDDQEGLLSELNCSAELISASRDESSVVEGGVMNLQCASGEHNHSHKHLLVKASLSPRSGASSKFGSFSARQPLSSPMGGAFSSCHSNTSSAAAKFVDPSLDIPVDPFADFDWMDESFADYSPHSLTLQARALLERQQNASHTRSRNKYKRLILGDDVAQFPALFMPEFDEAHLFSADQVKTSSSKHDGKHKHMSVGSIATTNPFTKPAVSAAVELVDSPTNREYLRRLDERAETVLIQRAWRCYLLLQNAQWGYRSGKRSLSVLHHDVRSALGCLTLNMVRLRAFSRQYQPTIQEYDRLLPELTALPASVGHLGVSKPLEDSTQRLEAELMRSRGAPLSPRNVQALKILMKESKLRQPVLLQHRLPYFVFVLHLEDNLLLYRPHDGSKNVQKLGGAGFIAYNKDNGIEDLSRANQSLMNTSIASMASFMSDKSGTPGVGSPASQSPQPPQRTPTSAPMGIAQVEKKAPPKGRTLEQKLSIMSLLSVLSGDSEGPEERAVPPTRAPLGSPSPASQTARRFFGASLDENQDLYALSSSDNTGSHDSSWGRLSASNASYIVPERAAARKTLARGELEGSSLGSVSTFLDAAIIAGKPVFKTREAELLYNLAAASGADQGCSGGRDHRRAIFAEMKSASGVLHSSLQFFLTVCESIKEHHQLQLVVAKPSVGENTKGEVDAGAGGVDQLRGERQLEAVSGKSGFISESSESSLNTLSILSLNSVSHSHLDHHQVQSSQSHAHLTSAPSAASSSFVALSASMSNMLGLFASSDSGNRHHKGEGTSDWDAEEEEAGPGRPPHRSLPLTVVCSHSAAALPWEALLLQTNPSGNTPTNVHTPMSPATSSAPVVRSLTLLSLCAQAYSATCCTIQQEQADHFAPKAADGKAQSTELALARAVVGPQWQQKATFVAVAYESRELPQGAVQELRASEEERRQRAARNSLIALLQPHPYLLGDTERAASRRDYFPTLQAGAHSPSSRTKHANFRTVLSTFEQGTLPSASPLFSNDKSSNSFFGKSDMIVNGQDCLSANALTLHSDTAPALPNPRAFWRKLPAAPPLRRVLSSAQLRPGCRVEAVPHSSFPLLVLSYVDYLQLSDALSYLVSHRPDAVLVFAPLFVIESLVIELKLSLDRWCKPDSLPSTASLPVEKVNTTVAPTNSAVNSASGAALSSSAGNRSATGGSSGRFLFSSFLNRGFSNSAGTGEASTSTLNFNESFLASGGASSSKDMDLMGMVALPPSSTSMSSSANASSATTLAGGHSAKRGSLPKIVEESPRDMSMSRSGSSSFSPGNQQRHLSPTRSRSNDALDALFEINSDTSLSFPATPTTITTSPNRPSETNNSSFSHSSSISRNHSLRDGQLHHHNNNNTSNSTHTKPQHSRSMGSINVSGRGATGQASSSSSHSHTHLATHTAAGSHTPSAASHTSSSFSGGSRRSGKSLKAKERTWVYHAVMAVVQDMQREHEVPIVVFI
eukprot:gene7621-9125_t